MNESPAEKTPLLKLRVILLKDSRIIDLVEQCKNIKTASKEFSREFKLEAPIFNLVDLLGETISSNYDLNRSLYGANLDDWKICSTTLIATVVRIFHEHGYTLEDAQTVTDFIQCEFPSSIDAIEKGGPKPWEIILSLEENITVLTLVSEAFKTL